MARVFFTGELQIIPHPCKLGRHRAEWLFALTCVLIFAAGGAAQSGAPAHGGESTTARACSLPGFPAGAGKSAASDDLLAPYNGRATLVQTLEVSAMLSVKGGAEYGSQARAPRPFPAMIDLAAPASLRLTGVVPFSGRRTFDISSDGRELRLLVPDGERMRIMVGPVDAPPTSPNPRENLRPQPLIDALRWAPAQLKHAAETSRAGDNGVRSLTLELAPATQGGPVRTARVEFDLRRGVVTKLTIQDPSQRGPTEIDYGGWQEWENSGETGSNCFPKRIVVAQPQQHLELEMKLISVQLNPQIPASKFRLTAPAGIPVTRMNPTQPVSHH